MLPINNAAISLGLGSKLHTKCFTLNNTFLLLRKKNKLKEKNIYLKSKVSKQEKKYKNVGKL